MATSVLGRVKLLLVIALLPVVLAAVIFYGVKTGLAWHAPDVVVTAPSNGDTVSGFVPVSVTYSVETGNVHTVQLRVDGVVVDSAAVHQQSGMQVFNWNTTSVAYGPHTIVARAYTAAPPSDHFADSEPVSVTVSNGSGDAPKIEITTPEAGETVSGTIIVSASFEFLNAYSRDIILQAGGHEVDRQQVSVKIGSVTFTLDTTAFANGPLEIKVGECPPEGGDEWCREDAVTVTVGNEAADTEAPVISITSPAQGLLTNAPLVAVEADLSDNVMVDAGTVVVKLDGADVTAQCAVTAMSVSCVLSPADGAHSATIDCKDASNNPAVQKSVSFTVDTAPPGVAVTQPADGTVVTSSAVNISGTVSDSLSGVSSVTVNGDAAIVNGASFNLNNVALSEGPNVITVIATDAAGNEAQSILTITYTPPACSSDAQCNDGDTHTEDVCMNGGTAAAACVYNTIACLNNADCDDSDSLTLDTCVNPGATASSCAHAPLQCNTAADCDDSDSQTTDACSNPGTVQSACTHTPVAVEPEPITLTLELSTPADGLITNVVKLNVTGTTATGATVTVNGAEVPVSAGGIFAKEITLSEGANNVTAKACLTGECLSETRHVVLDTKAPDITGAEADGKTIYILMADNPGGTGLNIGNIAVSLDGDDVTGAYDTAEKAYRIAAGGMEEGQHVVVASASDLAGNMAQKAMSFEYQAETEEDVQIPETTADGTPQETEPPVESGGDTSTPPDTGPTGDTGEVDTTPPAITNVSATPSPFSSANTTSIGVKDTTIITATVTDEHADVWQVQIQNQSGTVRSFSGTGTSVSIEWDGTDDTGEPLPDGKYTGIISALDVFENYSEASETLILDNTEPDSTILNPSKGDWVSPGKYTVRVQASDVNNIEKVEILLDSAYIGDASNVGKNIYEYTLNFTGMRNTYHVIAARAFDSAGNNAMAVSPIRIYNKSITIEKVALKNITRFGAADIRPGEKFRVEISVSQPHGTPAWRLVNSGRWPAETGPGVDVPFSVKRSDRKWKTYIYTAELHECADADGNIAPGVRIVSSTDGFNHVSLSGTLVVSNCAPAKPAAPVILRPRNGDKVKDSTPKVSGTAQPGVKVYIYLQGASGMQNMSMAAMGSVLSINDVLVATVETVPADGHFSAETIDLGIAGDKTIYAVAEKTFPNGTILLSAPSAPITFTLIDTDRPVVSGQAALPDPFSPGASPGVKDTTTITALATDETLISWRIRIYNFFGDKIVDYTESFISPSPTGPNPISFVWNGYRIRRNGQRILQPEGTYTYVITARDSRNRTSAPAIGTVTIDNTAPTVAITTPLEGEKIGAVQLNVAVVASDAVGMDNVEIYIDGELRGTASSDPSSPEVWRVSLNVAGIGPGPHVIEALAVDSAGNSSKSAPVNFVIYTVNKVEIEYCEAIPPIYKVEVEYCEATPPVEKVEVEYCESVPPINKIEVEYCEALPPVDRVEVEYCETIPPIYKVEVEYCEATPPVDKVEVEYCESVPPVENVEVEYCETIPPVDKVEVEYCEATPPVGKVEIEYCEAVPPIDKVEVEYCESVPPVENVEVEYCETIPPVDKVEVEYCEATPPVEKVEVEYCESVPPIDKVEVEYCEPVPPVENVEVEYCDTIPPVDKVEVEYCGAIPPVEKVDVEYCESVPPIDKVEVEYCEAQPPVDRVEVEYCETIPPIYKVEVEYCGATPLVDKVEVEYCETTPMMEKVEVEFCESTPPVVTDCEFAPGADGDPGEDGFSLTCTVNDEDENVSSVSFKDTAGVFGEAGGVIELLPGAGAAWSVENLRVADAIAAQIYTFTVTAQDGDGLTGTQDVQFTVNNVRLCRIPACPQPPATIPTISQNCNPPSSGSWTVPSGKVDCVYDGSNDLTDVTVVANASTNLTLAGFPSIRAVVAHNTSEVAVIGPAPSGAGTAITYAIYSYDDSSIVLKNVEMKCEVYAYTNSRILMMESSLFTAAGMRIYDDSDLCITYSTLNPAGIDLYNNSQAYISGSDMQSLILRNYHSSNVTIEKSNLTGAVYPLGTSATCIYDNTTLTGNIGGSYPINDNNTPDSHVTVDVRDSEIIGGLSLNMYSTKLATRGFNPSPGQKFSADLTTYILPDGITPSSKIYLKDSSLHGAGTTACGDSLCLGLYGSSQYFDSPDTENRRSYIKTILASDDSFVDIDGTTVVSGIDSRESASGNFRNVTVPGPVWYSNFISNGTNYFSNTSWVPCYFNVMHNQTITLDNDSQFDVFFRAFPKVGTDGAGADATIHVTNNSGIKRLILGSVYDVFPSSHVRVYASNGAEFGYTPSGDGNDGIWFYDRNTEFISQQYDPEEFTYQEPVKTRRVAVIGTTSNNPTFATAALKGPIDVEILCNAWFDTNGMLRRVFPAFVHDSSGAGIASEPVCAERLGTPGCETGTGTDTNSTGKAEPSFVYTLTDCVTKLRICDSNLGICDSNNTGGVGIEYMEPVDIDTGPAAGGMALSIDGVPAAKSLALSAPLSESFLTLNNMEEMSLLMADTPSEQEGTHQPDAPPAVAAGFVSPPGISHSGTVVAPGARPEMIFSLSLSPMSFRGRDYTGASSPRVLFVAFGGGSAQADASSGELKNAEGKSIFSSGETLNLALIDNGDGTGETVYTPMSLKDLNGWLKSVYSENSAVDFYQTGILAAGEDGRYAYKPAAIEDMPFSTAPARITDFGFINPGGYTAMPDPALSAFGPREDSATATPVIIFVRDDAAETRGDAGSTEENGALANKMADPGPDGAEHVRVVKVEIEYYETTLPVQKVEVEYFETSLNVVKVEIEYREPVPEYGNYFGKALILKESSGLHSAKTAGCHAAIVAGGNDEGSPGNNRGKTNVPALNDNFVSRLQIEDFVISANLAPGKTFARADFLEQFLNNYKNGFKNLVYDETVRISPFISEALSWRGPPVV